MTSHPSPQPPEPAPRRRRRWPWIAGILFIITGAYLTWNSFTLRRAYAQLDAVGLSVNPTDSLMDRILNDPGLIFSPGAWGGPKYWRRWMTVYQRDQDTFVRLRNLDAIACALRRIQPDAIHLDWAPSLENVDGLNGLDRIKVLSLEYCPDLQNLNALSSMTSLNELGLSDCSSLQNVDGIKGLTGLKFLVLKGPDTIPAAALSELRIALPNTEIIFRDEVDIPPK